MTSIIVPLYNMARYVGDTIESVLRQTDPNLELIIVNDGSTDHYQEVIRSFNDPRIKLIHNPHNIGVTATLNRGIKASQGQFISPLGADDLLTPQAIEIRLKHLKPSDMLICGQCINIPANCSLDEAYAKSWDGKWRYFYGPTSLYRRETFERWGLFDEQLPTRGCDREMYVRLFGRDRTRTDRGTFTCLPEMLGYFRVRPDSIQHSYHHLPEAKQQQIYEHLQRVIESRIDTVEGVEMLEVQHGR